VTLYFYEGGVRNALPDRAANLSQPVYWTDGGQGGFMAVAMGAHPWMCTATNTDSECSKRLFSPNRMQPYIERLEMANIRQQGRQELVEELACNSYT
jgi:hypothetical protein